MEDIKRRLEALGYGEITFTQEILENVKSWCEAYIRVFCSVGEISGELQGIRDDYICIKLIERAVLNGEIQENSEKDGVSSITEGDFSIKFSDVESSSNVARKTAMELFMDLKERMIAYRRIKWS